jgi:hypothetical protein
MIIDIWRPVFKGSGHNRNLIYYEIFEGSIEKKGYVVRYTCDSCGKFNNTTSSSLLNKNYVYNTTTFQTCRACRSRISEYEIKKTQIPFLKIFNSFKEHNYILLSNQQDYENSFNKSQFRLNVICKRGHNYYVSWNNWSKGKRCRLCYNEDKVESAVKYKIGFSLYHFLVWQLTNKNYKKFRKMINPDGLLRSNNLHLDHIYSIYDGFLNNVPAFIIASPHNLRLVSCSKNLSKGKKSEIMFENLCEKIFSSILVY